MHRLLRGPCRSGIVAAGVLAVAGCASAPATDPGDLVRPRTVRVLPGAAMDPAAVRAVIAPDAAKDSKAADELAARAQRDAEAEAQRDWASALAGMPGWRLATAPLAAAPDLQALGRPGAAPLAEDSRRALRSAAGADAVLRFAITDYGQTPKAWRHGVIAFEVASTLGIAALAYVRPATRAIAGAYLLQEGVEESIEAYSGFWALDEAYRPVRVQAELVDLDSGRTLWSDSETGFSDRRLSRLWTTVPLDERRHQLEASLQEAIGRLATQLRSQAARQGR